MSPSRKSDVVDVDVVVTIRDKRNTEFKMNLEIDKADIDSFSKTVQRILTFSQSAPAFVKLLLSKYGL